MQYFKSSVKKDAEQKDELEIRVREIIRDVIQNGDSALLSYNLRFDGCDRESFRVSREEIESAYAQVSEELLGDMKKAAENISAFAKAQKDTIKNLESFEAAPGVMLGHRVIPIQSCCCYVPGGS